ncbi:hypothetical protein [Chengkuizengella sediminis]|uniref:hypothetical protein n=1 Tax=Chengkuizengella sediminis TaxID=1885917 RepID=UPI001389E552|nr:hypothetical protein [Chengkuizengella sediminis]NDI33206.1 hypothetical protein [Chengkuizengella sediminis]
MWERANPESTSYSVTKQQGTTPSGSYDLVTEGSAGSSASVNDIDSGVTSIQSPADGSLTLSFSYYLSHYSNANSEQKRITIDFTSNSRLLFFRVIVA